MSNREELNVLSLQPFYGGSHRQFDVGWQSHSRHRWTVLSLPDRHWKWRMRHAPIEFARLIQQRASHGESWDAIVCTDMLDVATLKGLCDRLPPILVYFHENQFEYPSQVASPFDHHYAFTNLVSALAADEVWFNSEFNRQSMMDGIKVLAKRFPDFSPAGEADVVLTKSAVQPPGVKTNCSDCSAGKNTMPPDFKKSANGPLKIIWAARWEHDKGPDLLLQILGQLLNEPNVANQEFEISIVGQQFRQQPAAFGKIQKRFGDQIKHWGHLDRSSYDNALADAHVFLSTANHEFFGLSFVEAVCHNAWPLVPNRLAYPELLAGDQNRTSMVYETADEAVEKLRVLASQRDRVLEGAAAAGQVFRQRYGWEKRAIEMDDRLVEMVVENGGR